MPTYDYRCRTCGITFEHFQSITSDALQHCPVDVCTLEQSLRGTGEVERLISAGAGLLFKGSGFYLTDYARNSESAESSTERKAAATQAATTAAETTAPKVDAVESSTKPASTKESPTTDTAKKAATKEPKEPATKKSSKPKDD